MTSHPQAQDRKLKSPQSRWLMGLRLVISTFLMVSLSLTKVHGNLENLSLQWLNYGLAAVAIYYLLAIAFYFSPAHGRAAVFHQWAQVVADLVLAICLSFITGGGDSPFSFLFLIAIINSSFLGGIRSALVVATFSAALWGAQLTLQDTGFLALWLPELKTSQSTTYMLPEMSGRLIRILINTGACYLVAVLSGYLAGQLFQSRRALVRSQVHLDRLADLNENIIQSIDSGLITLDQNGLILSVNRAGMDLLGRKYSEMAGRPWQLFLPQLEHILPLSQRSRAGLLDVGGLRFEYVRAPDGQELLLELNVLALMDESGEIWGRLLVLKDLTSFQQMETAMRKAEHLAALGELAAGLAHELRTPLASMTGAWHMLSQSAPDPDDQKRLISIIGREMERLAKLTSDFLSFARPARANPRRFDLPALVADQLNILKHSQAGKLTVDSRLGVVPAVFFDPDQLVQIFWNLVANAMEAGEKTPNFQLQILTGLEPGWPRHVMLRISDNGPGISHENQEKLFEPFFTTKTGGSGLGLAIVNRILHEGGGHITVSSGPRGLTSFSVFLPQAGR